MAQVALTEIDRIAAEAIRALVDPEAIQDFGSAAEASFRVSLELGIVDGDMAKVLDDETLQLRHSLAQIRQRLDHARRLKQLSWSTQRILSEGLATA